MLDVTEFVYLRRTEEVLSNALELELAVDSVVDDLHPSTTALAGTHMP